MFAYDEVPYPGYCHPQLQPNRLAVPAHIYGMRPASPERCRVLELGCGSGDSLISFALSLTESSFLGVDLSAIAVDKGKRVISELGLRNIRLEQCDLVEFRGGEYDYIVAHGLFSWVPPAVQSRIFEIVRDCLAPEGVAYVSYNALPGGHFPLMTREMMLYHGEQCTSAKEKMEQACALVELIAGAQEQPNEYGRLFADEWKRITERPLEAIYHDELGPWTAPLYFHEFVARAAGYGLQYLTEAVFHETQAHNLRPHAAKILHDCGDDVIRREQYMDFLRGRRFRQTLLCRDFLHIQREIPAERIADLYAGADLAMEVNPDWASGGAVKFTDPKNIKFSSTDPMTTAALMYLTESWPVPVRLDALLENVRAKLARAGCKRSYDSPEHLADLAGAVLRLYASGVVQFWLAPPRITSRPGSCPLASPLARLQAQQQERVTTLLHTMIELDPTYRFLLQLLDGSRDRTSLLAEVERAVELGESAPGDLVDAGLAIFARSGLLLQ